MPSNKEMGCNCGVHLHHCGYDCWDGEVASCKYGDANCPMVNSPVVKSMQARILELEARPTAEALADTMRAYEVVKDDCAACFIENEKLHQVMEMAEKVLGKIREWALWEDKPVSEIEDALAAIAKLKEGSK